MNCFLSALRREREKNKPQGATMRNSKMLWIMAAVITGLAAPRFLSGQAYYSTLVGTVRDTSGGVVPNAQVAAIEVTTDVKTSASTNAAGDYRIENLRPGTYSVQATAQGFSQKIAS